MTAAPATVEHWVEGCDPTPGIVSLDVPRPGRARVWRRVEGGGLELSEVRFPSWFLAEDRALIEYLPAESWQAERIRSAHGALNDVRGIRVVALDEGNGDEEAYRYLVLADEDSYAIAEAGVLDAWRKYGSHDEREALGGHSSARSLEELARTGVVAVWPRDDQYLLLSGRTLFKGLAFGDLHRLQFDLETTGLDERHDRVFLISLSDSNGWTDCLEAVVPSEDPDAAERVLLERFVAVIRERDPDILENHNIFEFDLRFLVARAALLGVHLGIGRDGSAPLPVPDTLRTGERAEGFVRWVVAGREVLDTLHAVKRHGALSRGMRRHGLKDAARFFGLARDDREYVPGAEIWRTFQDDPERVRRYAAHDVHEVDALSRQLHGVPFALARALPRRYQQIASDWSPLALVEPLLVRAYLHQARAIPSRQQDVEEPGVGGVARARLYVRGVVRNVVRLHVPTVTARFAAMEGTRPYHDDLGAFPALLTALLQREERARSEASAATIEGLRQLARACVEYLGTPGALFGDRAAGQELALRTRESMKELGRAAESLGPRRVLLDGENLFLALEEDQEPALLALARRLLPAGTEPRIEQRFRAMYALAEHSYLALGTETAPDGSDLHVVGPAFHRGVQERFAERFVRDAAVLLLIGDTPGVRGLFVEAVRRLRAGEIPTEQLCLQVTLHKSPQEYRRTGQPQEPYETLLAAGIRDWRPGHRVRYFRERTGAWRLLRDGETLSGSLADARHYVNRLRGVYCQLFADALQTEEFERIFALPEEPSAEVPR